MQKKLFRALDFMKDFIYRRFLRHKLNYNNDIVNLEPLYLPSTLTAYFFFNFANSYVWYLAYFSKAQCATPNFNNLFEVLLAHKNL